MDHGSGDELDSPDSRRSPSGSDAPLSRAPSNRILFDNPADDDGEGERTRQVKDKLKGPGSFSGGRGSTWTSSVPVPASDIPINPNKNRMMSRHDSTRMSDDSDPTIQPDISAVPDSIRSTSLLRTPSRPAERSSGRFDYDNPMKRLQMEEQEESEGEEEGGKQEPPERMSLMSLLAGYDMDDDEDDEEEDDVDSGVENNCCICMVRHRGTAFEPCGHSFCRLCSREMWVQGGNCPLCNNYILEILDIF